MKFDDAAWHMQNAADESRAIAHIATFFRWCVDRGFVSEEHTVDPELRKQLQRVEAGRLTAGEYLWENTSGKLEDGDLVPEVIPFVKWYYKRHYFDDFAAVIGGSSYSLPETAVDFSAVAQRLDVRYREWRGRPAKPWWRVW
jgi:hypothetical protein